MRAILLVLLCSVSVLADGINKPKHKHKPKRKAVKTEVTKVVVKPIVKPIKPPELLTTKYDEVLGYPFMRPLQPLNNIPPLKPELITTREVAEYPFEESHKPKFLFILIGAAAIPFLIPHGDNTPPPIAFVPPQITPFGVNPTTGPTPDSTPGSTPVPIPEPRSVPTPEVVPTTTVPEPTSIILFVSGLAIMLRRRVTAHFIKTRR
jgi:hypothetical protein